VDEYLRAFSKIRADYYKDLAMLKMRGPGSTLKEIEIYYKYIIDGNDMDKIERNLWEWLEGGKLTKNAERTIELKPEETMSGRLQAEFPVGNAPPTTIAAGAAAVLGAGPPSPRTNEDRLRVQRQAIAAEAQRRNAQAAAAATQSLVTGSPAITQELEDELPLLRKRDQRSSAKTLTITNNLSPYERRFVPPLPLSRPIPPAPAPAAATPVAAATQAMLNQAAAAAARQRRAEATEEEDAPLWSESDQHAAAKYVPSPVLPPPQEQVTAIAEQVVAEQKEEEEEEIPAATNVNVPRSALRKQPDLELPTNLKRGADDTITDSAARADKKALVTAPEKPPGLELTEREKSILRHQANKLKKKSGTPAPPQQDTTAEPETTAQKIARGNALLEAPLEDDDLELPYNLKRAADQERPSERVAEAPKEDVTEAEMSAATTLTKRQREDQEDDAFYQKNSAGIDEAQGSMTKGRLLEQRVAYREGSVLARARALEEQAEAIDDAIKRKEITPEQGERMMKRLEKRIKVDSNEEEAEEAEEVVEDNEMEDQDYTVFTTVRRKTKAKQNRIRGQMRINNRLLARLQAPVAPAVAPAIAPAAQAEPDMPQRARLNLSARPTKRQEAMARSERGLPPIQQEEAQAEPDMPQREVLKHLANPNKRQQAIARSQHGHPPIQQEIMDEIEEEEDEEEIEDKLDRLLADLEESEQGMSPVEKEEHREILAQVVKEEQDTLLDDLLKEEAIESAVKLIMEDRDHGIKRKTHPESRQSSIRKQALVYSKMRRLLDDDEAPAAATTEQQPKAKRRITPTRISTSVSGESENGEKKKKKKKGKEKV